MYVSTSRSNQKKYVKTNAYSHRASLEQILTLVLFIIHFVMHCVFLIRPIVKINNQILYVSWIIFYLLLVLMAIDYCIITCGDPVDLALVDDIQLMHYRTLSQQFRKKLTPEQRETVENPYKIRYCEECGHSVKSSSYHCWRCGRCVEGMDHHCKYLNNCIGARNYTPFFRMLIATTIYLLLSVMHCIWVFVKTYQSQRINQLVFNRWAVIVLLVFSTILIFAVDSLLCFHCYISCCRKMTTIEYLFRETPSNVPSSATNKSSKNEKNKMKIEQVEDKKQGDSAQNIMHKTDEQKQGNNSEQMFQQQPKTPSPNIQKDNSNDKMSQIVV